jgi:hypothetical protein
MGKISCRDSRLVSAIMARIAAVVRNRLGRCLITPLPQESVGERQVSAPGSCNLPTLFCQGPYSSEFTASAECRGAAETA